jgi:DNA topoisomerase-1
MKLVVVESPSKAKTISKYLGDGYLVRASVGHVRDLPKSSKKAIDIEAGFVPHYEIDPKKEPVIADISKEAKKAEDIILATDPDREGEAIAWHLSQVLADRLGAKIQSKISRITFHEITKEAVNEAITHPREIDENLRSAQEARRVLDRLFGYDLSQLIWKKVRYGLSAGRVQSPALRIIVEREREIQSFIPEKYWTISGTWKTLSDQIIDLTCKEEPRDEKVVRNILDEANKSKWLIKDIENTEQKRSPRAPFTTSTLQQVASSRFGFSPSRTMGIAQKLYEAGHITYMRTDSTNLSNQALAQIAETIKKNFGEQYVLVRKYATKSKNAQEAHEAIRPTNSGKLSAGANDEQKRLYKLIWQRTVSSQMSDAMIARSKIIANTESNSVPDFEATGSKVIFDGWLKADPDSAGDEVRLPKCNKNDNIKLQSIDSIEKATTPPPRYTEAGLIKELEKRGIGRPSTYASICKTIEDRGYVTKENKALRPTDTGEVVSTFLEQNFPTYISDSFTALMEDELDDIANGTRKYLKTLKDFYGPFHNDVKAKDKIAKITNLGLADDKFRCPKCGSDMDIKLGKNGKFMSCSRYPECDGALTMEGVEFKKDEPIGTDPTSGLPIFVLNGRFGPYVQLGYKLEKKKRTSLKKQKSANQTSIESTSPSENTPSIKPRMASIPRNVDPSKVTITDALKYLSVPRTLGIDPKTNKEVTASIGRFGPYVASDGNFRSIKIPDDVYNITLERALELLAIPKAPRKGRFTKKKE